MELKSFKTPSCQYGVLILLMLTCSNMGLDTGCSAFAGDLVINEVMSSNAATIYDEDGNAPDWIEVYNRGGTPIDINRYGLSDDDADPVKWLFPDVTLGPSEHILVFASDKDRSFVPLHWVTVINWGDEWRYLVPSEEPPADWLTVGFDDGKWSTGLSGFGYGDGDDATPVPPAISIYMRKVFTVADADNYSEAFLHIDYDDAFIAYLNGEEIARGNIGNPGDPTPHDQPADTGTHEASIYQGGAPEQFEIDRIGSILREGGNVLAIQVHNIGTGSSDMTAIPFLTLGVKNRPAEPALVPDILNFALRYLHTNFKIKSDGETLVLSDEGGQVLDRVETGQIQRDISFGRRPDGGGNWYYFLEPTPAGANTTQGFQGDSAGEPQFSHQGGFYSSGISLMLSGDGDGDTVHFSLDGTDPTAESDVSSEAIRIDATTVVRARIINSGTLPGKTITNTYFIDREFTLPVVSIATTPSNLWDEETGIYVKGNSASAEFPYFGANFWQDWERPAHVEFYDTDGVNGFRLDAGIKIFGGYLRGQDQKSLSIFARRQYGTGDIGYRLFGDKDISRFEAFVLRNSGNDWRRSLFRDGMMTTLLRDLDIERQGFRPATVYLNGEYWGILNIREKINEHFIAANKNVDPDNIDLLEGYGNAIHGDTKHYDGLRSFISDNDLSIEANYDYVGTQMNVDNYILYTLSMIYFDNRDWPGNNIKFWRPRTPTGKWRWIVYDTDFGFGLYDEDGYLDNTLEFALEPNGSGWPNPPWATLLLRRLMLNDQFKRDFVNSFADQLNTAFKAERVLATIETYEHMLLTEMPYNLDRWDGTMVQWHSDVSVMREFAGQRVPYVRQHIGDRFGLTDTHDLMLNVSSSGGGKIRVNTIEIETFPWRGVYFEGNPIRVSAVPRTGYRFAGWSGAESDSQTLEIDLTDDIAIVADFEEDENYVSPIVINEINYSSAAGSDSGDWIELYNHSDITMDISGWVLRDSEDAHGFTIPAHTAIEGRKYAILCRDRGAFSALYPEVDSVVGDFDFGLGSAGDIVRLYDDAGGLVDSLAYSGGAPWPEEANGNGPTLELIGPEHDNSLPESWIAGDALGTPGAANTEPSGADLAVAIGVDNVMPHEDDTIVYTIALTNNGPNTATGVTMTDQLPAGVSFVSAEEGRGSYLPSSGVWTVGALTRDDSATLRITATVDVGMVGATITNTASDVSSNLHDPTVANNTSSISIIIAPENPGDVDNNGSVNTADVQLIMAIIFGERTPTPAEFARANVDASNQQIDIADLLGCIDLL